MKIFLGTDHAGYELKEQLKTYLNGMGHQVEDLGAFSYVEDDDYPDYVKKVAEEVAKHPAGFGIILGGSGEGEAICANRFTGVRAFAFYGPKEPLGAVDIEGKVSHDTFEIVKLAREHNNANIISIGARFVSVDEAKFAIELFLATKFRNQERHLRRIEKLDSEQNG